MKPFQYIKDRITIVSFMLLLSSTLMTNCKKLVEVNPPIDRIIGDEIYKSDVTAISIMTGIYTLMSGYSIFDGPSSVSVTTGLSADELVSTTQPSTFMNVVYLNSISNQGDGLFWTDLYGFIFRVNSTIEGLSKSTTLSTEVKQQLIGEAKFLRALYYFYLVNLYGDVPLLTSTDLEFNIKAPRVAASIVYDQIIKDLKEARELLNTNYLAADTKSIASQRLRPNKSVATALLARVYLYTKDYRNAEIEASAVIENGSYDLEPLSNVFLIKSREAIWQLQPKSIGDNTIDARTFVLKSGTMNSSDGPDGESRPVYLSKSLFNSFPADDQRKKIWIDSVNVGVENYPFAYKYKAWDINQPRSEYIMVIRLAELYLIRAESRVRQGNILGPNSGESDINMIRLRAGLLSTSASNESEMLDEIKTQRRHELFTEWGHRWLDMKRLGVIDQIMTDEVKLKGNGATWQPFKALYPIPIQDIIRNSTLRGHQNPGYPER